MMEIDMSWFASIALLLYMVGFGYVRTPLPVRAGTSLMRVSIVVLLFALLPFNAMATQLNGLDTGTLQVVKVSERATHRSAITDIRHVSAPGDWRENTYVIGAVVNDQAIAYPLAVLMWHWILNDTIEGQALVVVFCQICGSGMLYERSVGDQVLTFNASGLLYRYNMLLFDNETKSLWSWETDSAVAGPLKDSALALIKTETTTLKSWLEQYPGSLIVEAPDRVTGIDYRFTPNDTSALGESVFSGLRITVEQIHPYTPVVGLVVDDQAIAIPASEVLHAGGKVTLEVAEERLDVAFNVEQQRFITSNEVAVTITDLVSWRKSYPATTVYSAALK